MIRLLPLALVLVVAGDAGATRPTKGRPLVTGQSAVYGAAGERTSGMSRMFNDLGTGVVKDQRTGLFWEKKSDDGGIHDKDATFTWAAAETFGNSLTSATFAGRAVWCLPSREKLNGILDATQPGCGAPPLVTPCIAPIFGPTNPDAYWTSEQQDPTTAWTVNFADAVEVQQLRSSARFVRAISSASCL